MIAGIFTKKYIRILLKTLSTYHNIFHKQKFNLKINFYIKLKWTSKWVLSTEAAIFIIIKIYLLLIWYTLLHKIELVYCRTNKIHMLADCDTVISKYRKTITNKPNEDIGNLH